MVQPAVSCETAAEAIEAFGGNAAFARWQNMRPNLVADWKQRGFPASKFLVLTEAFRAHGIAVSARAFNVEVPEPEGAAA